MISGISALAAANGSIQISYRGRTDEETVILSDAPFIAVGTVILCRGFGKWRMEVVGGISGIRVYHWKIRILRNGKSRQRNFTLLQQQNGIKRYGAGDRCIRNCHGLTYTAGRSVSRLHRPGRSEKVTGFSGQRHFWSVCR